MDEYFDILMKNDFPPQSVYYECETPEQLLIELEKLKVMYAKFGYNIDPYDSILHNTISEIKMLNRTKIINKINEITD